MTEVQKRKLNKYLYRRQEYLDYCRASFENMLQDDKQQMVDAVNRKELAENDPELGRALFRLEYPVATTFRYCMLVAVCTFLEESLRTIGNLAFDDYDSKTKQQKSGNWLRKALRVYKSLSGIDLIPIKEQTRLFDQIIGIRNAIVHCWGKVDACRSPANVRKIIGCNNWAEETRDGYIFLSDEAYAEAVEATEEIIEHLLNEIPASD